MNNQRMTRQKQLVLDIAKSHNDHPTADQIYLEVRDIDSKISRGTVYRNLSQLADSGLLTHVKVPGPDRYDWRLDFHCHMVCQNCGSVFDAPLNYREDIDKLVSDKTGFIVQRHRTIFEGLCHDCANKLKVTELE